MNYIGQTLFPKESRSLQVSLEMYCVNAFHTVRLQSLNQVYLTTARESHLNELQTFHCVWILQPIWCTSSISCWAHVYAADPEGCASH